MSSQCDKYMRFELQYPDSKRNILTLIFSSWTQLNHELGMLCFQTLSPYFYRVLLKRIVFPNPWTETYVSIGRPWSHDPQRPYTTSLTNLTCPRSPPRSQSETGVKVPGSRSQQRSCRKGCPCVYRSMRRIEARVGG